MTRKDYILMAKVLHEEFEYAFPESQSTTTIPAFSRSSPASTWRPQYATGYVDGLLGAVKRLSDAFAADNPRFNQEHFLAVVRGEKPLNSRPMKSKKEPQ